MADIIIVAIILFILAVNLCVVVLGLRGSSRMDREDEEERRRADFERAKRQLRDIC